MYHDFKNETRYLPFCLLILQIYTAIFRHFTSLLDHSIKLILLILKILIKKIGLFNPSKSETRQPNYID